MSALTEGEAAEAWCPFTRNGNQAGSNRDGHHLPFATCVASRCMAWRWISAGHADAAKNRGFCGLAGKPEIWSVASLRGGLL